VTRDRAHFIDPKFTDADPPWRCPDIWIDWLGNGRETYPDGSPYGQGDAVRFPNSGTEPHRIVARVHNGGDVDALNVDVRFYLCEPAGAGDQGQFRLLGNMVINSVGAGSTAQAEVPWDVSSANTRHQCVLAQIADWDIPQASGGGTVPVFAATTDLWLSNNRAQKNLVDFQQIGGSPYRPTVLNLAVANDGPEEVLVYLEPVGMPSGVTLTCAPRTLHVPAKATGQFVVTVNADIGTVAPGAGSDATFILHACRWTRDRENVEAAGGWALTIRPRQETAVTLAGTSTPPGVQVTGTVAGAGPTDRIWLRMLPSGSRAPTWTTAPVRAGGSFLGSFPSVPIGTTSVQLEAHFDGNAILAAASAGPVTIPVPGGVTLPGGGGIPTGGNPTGGIPTGGIPIGGGPVVVGLHLAAPGNTAEASDDS
jgi:hypothetical protein